MAFLTELSNKAFPNSAGKAKAEEPAPFLLMILKKCTFYRIDASLVYRLNYSDLLALIVEFDIQALKDYLYQKKDAFKGEKEIVDVAPEDVGKALAKL